MYILLASVLQSIYAAPTSHSVLHFFFKFLYRARNKSKMSTIYFYSVGMFYIQMHHPVKMLEKNVYTQFIYN